MKISQHQRIINERDLLTALLLLISLFTILFLFFSPLLLAENDNTLFTPRIQKGFLFQALFTS